MYQVTSVQVNKNRVISTLLFLLCARIIAMFFIPLNDSTEARYGEIARIMLETGDWITPMQEYGVPFWAKPPLSTWLASLSMSIFGVNEFAARLPALILSIGVLWLVWHITKLRHGVNFALIAILILAGSFFFYLDAGTIMTDPALLFAISLTLISFWLAVSEKRKLWGYIFFVAYGLGMLAKGPVAWVLTCLPLGLWVIINKKWHAIWKNLPWLQGGLLAIAIFLPWYILAEQKTPGFINYFIIGENISRFLKPGWDGDMYGGAHLAPYGYIWLYAIIGIFPWIIPFLSLLVKNFRSIPFFLKDSSGWVSYLLLCTVIPLIFFTFASNIIYPYVFPILPFFALLFVEFLYRCTEKKYKINYLTWLATSSGIIFLLMSMVFVYKPDLVEKSQKRVVKLYDNHKTINSQLIYWLPKADFSARFYTAGNVLATNNLHDLRQIINNNKQSFFVVNSKYFADLPQDMLEKMQKVGKVNVSRNEYVLFKI